MEIIEVKGSTSLIDTGMSYIPFYKLNKEEIILFDTGWARGEREGIQEILDKNNYKISAIVCTHAHIDHIGNNTYFKEKYNCVIAMSAFEAYCCSNVSGLKLYFNSKSLAEAEEHFGHMVCKTDIYILPDQKNVNICGIDLKIIHTPGHSPAHICIITPDDVAYLGDSLISYEVMEGSKLPYAYILREDLTSKYKLFSLNCSKYIVAHKGLYDDISKLITDNIIFYKHRAELIYAVIDGEMTFEDILKVVIKEYRIRVNSRYRYEVIERMMRSYVEYLNETGAIELNISDGFLKYSKKRVNV